METMKLDGIKGMEEAIRWMRSEVAQLILLIEGDVDATNSIGIFLKTKWKKSVRSSPYQSSHR
jgi:hypothetical protein